MRALKSTRRCTVSVLAAGILLAGGVTTAATAASSAGTDSRGYPDRIFADDSFWYRALPQDTPVASNSAQIVDGLYDQAESHWGAPGKPNIGINTTHYSPPVYVARAGDPLVTFDWDNCQGKGNGDTGLIADHLTGIRVPADALPARGSDGEMVIYDPASDTLTEVWQASRTSGGWSACWGGTIRDAGRSDGVHDRPFGVAASGLSLAGGLITAEELRTGDIDHVIGLAIPFATPGATSWPATRTDARNPGGRPTPAQGQMMRLPADLDLDSLNLSPVARAIAEAAQTYGVVVWDTSGAVGFRAENPVGLAGDPYPEIFRGRDASQEMLGNPSRGEDPFPLDRLEVLPVDYQAPVGHPAPEPAR